MASSIKKVLKLASNQSVKTACVCIVFFFHYFKYYGQNIFSRMTGQKEKRSKMFQVKAISKDVRKTIVPSLMFLFNLSKSVVLCVKKM